jgi:hypothetical protein
MKADWYIILLCLLAFVMIGLNELGYGVFALPRLFPASWLMTKAFEQENLNKL